MKYIIVENEKSDFHITAHKYAPEAVRFAASELQKYIRIVTNAVVPYFSDRCGRVGREISLGENVRGHNNDLSGLTDEGYIIREDGEDIVITGKTGRAVLYGVYRFLELFCGFACYTKDCEVIDKIPRLEIELDYIAETPSFSYREPYFRNAFDGGFASKNRINGTLADISEGKGGKVKWFNLHHAFFDLVRPELYFDEHPEYFSEIDGKRVSDGQLCLSNPDVLEIAKETLRRWISENPACKVFSVAQNDNQRFCTCEKCRAIDEAEGCHQGSILRFVNALAEDIEKDYPDVRLHNFAYQYSTETPKITRARDNVIIRLCNIACRFDKPFSELAKENPDGREAEFVRLLSEWQNSCRELYVWSYAVNFRNYLMPFFHFHSLAESLRMYKKLGVTGLLEEGNFSYGGGAAMDDLKAYVIAKLMWNPWLDVDVLIDNFLRGVFGEKAGRILREYIDMTEKAESQYPLTIYMNPDAPAITDEWVEKSILLFEKAVEAAENEVYRARVMREQLSVRYMYLTRLPMEAPLRNEKIEQFISDAKRMGVTELHERIEISGGEVFMKYGQYCISRPDASKYSNYYIMQ